MAAPTPVTFMRNLLIAMGQQYYDGDDGHRVERRLRFYAAAYMVLAASFLFRAVPGPSGGADSAANAITGFLLWIAAVALLLLSFVHQRLPTAAVAVACIAQAALEPLFELP